MIGAKALGGVAVAAILIAPACSGDGHGTATTSTSGNGGDGSSSSSGPATSGGGGGALPTIDGGGGGGLPGTDAVVDDTIDVPDPATQPQPPQPQPPTPSPPPPFIPSDVLFDTGSADLRTDADPYLRTAADEIRSRNPVARLRFIGHTDSRGSSEYNLELSRRRAEALRQWFIGYGFDPTLLSSEGAGESQPISPDTRPDGIYDEGIGRGNRRVEILIIA